MFDTDPDAEWVRLEESWTAATETPWRFEQDEEDDSAAVIVWVLGAIIVWALVALGVWAWTR